VMSIGMMLPTSLPLIALFTMVVRDRPNRASLVLLVCMGYLLVGTVAGSAHVR
jgi:predicted metal-binding membrane protein